MKRTHWLVTVVSLLAAGSFAACAAEPTLKVGDAAPKLQQGKYIQGEPVKDFEKGTAIRRRVLGDVVWSVPGFNPAFEREIFEVQGQRPGVHWAGLLGNGGRQSGTVCERHGREDAISRRAG